MSGGSIDGPSGPSVLRRLKTITKKEIDSIPVIIISVNVKFNKHNGVKADKGDAKIATSLLQAAGRKLMM